MNALPDSPGRSNRRAGGEQTPPGRTKQRRAEVRIGKSRNVYSLI